MAPRQNPVLNQLFYGDNLAVLRDHIPSQSVDLIYLDPPFNSRQDYNVLFAEKDGARSASQITAFKDTWEWNEESSLAYEQVVEAGGRVAEAMRAFRTLLGGTDMLAYLAMMAPRLVELRRVLKDSGSIYLHCDPTASHYLKLLWMASSARRISERNHLAAQQRSQQTQPSVRTNPRHNLFPCQKQGGIFKPGVRPVSRGYVREWFTSEDERGPYRTNMLTGPGKERR